MAEYQSSHTGLEIDQAVSAVANKQDTLVSGTNIKTINNTSLLGSGDITITAGVSDVQVNGTSVVSSGVANIPVAGGTPGVVKVSSANGINIMSGTLYTVCATEQEITAKSTDMKAIVPNKLDIAVREGLGNNSLTWTDGYKASARTTISAEQATTASTVTSGTTVTLAKNTVYTGTSITELTVAYPASVDATFVSELDITTGASITLTLPSGIVMKGDDCSNGTFTPTASTTYNIMFASNGTTNYGVVMKLS